MADVIVIFHFGLFFALLPSPLFCSFSPNSRKNENSTKMKNTVGDIVILHKFTKNHDHMLCRSWDMACDTCNFCFSFWAIFCTFTISVLKSLYQGADHNICNLKYWIPGCILTVCYNLSGYGAHLFVKEQGKKFNKDDIRVIVENKESTLALMSRLTSSWQGWPIQTIKKYIRVFSLSSKTVANLWHQA